MDAAELGSCLVNGVGPRYSPKLSFLISLSCPTVILAFRFSERHELGRTVEPRLGSGPGKTTQLVKVTADPA